MRQFIFGFLAGVIAVGLAAFAYLRSGALDPRADIPINSLERAVAMPSLDASVDRHAPTLKNPLDSSDATLIAGMKIYQSNCASCHGDVTQPHASLAESFYPRAPQFVEDSPDMPEYQNFFIIQHGVRLTGMPAWRQSLSDAKIWQVTTFLSHMDKLSRAVSDAWNAEATATPQNRCGEADE